MKKRLSIVVIIVLAALTILPVDGLAAKKKKKANKGKKAKQGKTVVQKELFEGTWTLVGKFSDTCMSKSNTYFDPEFSMKQMIDGKKVWPCQSSTKVLAAAVKGFAKKDPDFPKTLEKLFGKPVKITAKGTMFVCDDGKGCQFDWAKPVEWKSIELLPQKKKK